MSNIDVRRSIRLYSDKLVDREILIKLCESGFLAPSARNQDSRAFIIIDDKETINKLSTVSIGAKVLENATACIAVIGINKNNIPTPLMQSADLAASTENILLSAVDYNLGTCWIGLYPIEERSNKAKEILGVSGDDFVYSLISIGYVRDEKEFNRREDKIKYDHIYVNRME